MEFNILSVADRRATLEACSLLRTSLWDMACSGVTSYGSLLKGSNEKQAYELFKH